MALVAEQRDEPAGPHRHDGVGEQVEERGGEASDGSCFDAEQDEAGVVDRGVGQHALDVALAERDECPEDQ